MLFAKRTAKNQITLPKSLTQAIGPVEYFEVTLKEGQIILTPVNPQGTALVRAKLAELEITDSDITAAITWARNAELPTP